MKSVNIQAAKTHLSRLVERAAAGEEIILAKAGKPLAKLVPYQAAQRARTGGQLAGQIWCAPDCWMSDGGGLDDAIDGPLYATGPVSSAGLAAELPSTGSSKP